MRLLKPKYIFILAVLSFVACNRSNNDSEKYLPADVVTNPNTAEGSTDTGKLPVLTFEEMEHDFGKLIEGETVSYNFKFKNTGKTDLVIADVSTSCGCTVPSYPKTAIRPGEEGILKIAFNSQGRKGFQTKNIVVVANTQPNITNLRIKAQVVSPGSQ